MLASASRTRVALRGVVCDMDGTLVTSCINFASMYARVGVPRSQDLLAVIASWPDVERRAAAHAIIVEEERAALARLALAPGAVALGEWCAARGVPLGLVTRNNFEAVAHFHSELWPLPPLAPAVSRDDGLPPKPHPAALLHCAQAWGVQPGECVMVGDSARDDVVAGRRAGMRTILLSGAAARPPAAAGEALQDERVPCAITESLEGVPLLLEQLFA